MVFEMKKTAQGEKILNHITHLKEKLRYNTIQIPASYSCLPLSRKVSPLYTFRR